MTSGGNFKNPAFNKGRKKYDPLSKYSSNSPKSSQLTPEQLSQALGDYLHTKKKKLPIYIAGKKKKIRKHRGINQNTGRLKKGYKYSGKLKSGLSRIVQVKKKKN